jgi:hypothetical protein
MILEKWDRFSEKIVRQIKSIIGEKLDARHEACARAGEAGPECWA